MAGSDSVSQPIDAATLARLGIHRLNLGSGKHVARDYGDPASLYIDEDGPSGELEPSPIDPRILMVDRRFAFLRLSVPPLPFATGSVREICCEHLIEHLTPGTAVALVREVRRILAPGGVFRLSTPDLRRYLRAFTTSSDAHDFVRSRWETLAPVLADQPEPGEFRFGDRDADTARPTFLLNQLFHLWGHLWIYDFDEVARLLSAAGFERSTVREVAFRQGSCDALARWDTTYRADESLYVEVVLS